MEKGSTDPRKFEKSAEDTVDAVAQTTFDEKVAGYAQLKKGLRRDVLQHFLHDVRAASDRALKQIIKRAWERYTPHQATLPTSEATALTPDDRSRGADVHGEGAREQVPDPEKIVLGKRSVNRQQAARYLGVSERQIYNLVQAGKLEEVGEGKNKRILVESLRRRRGD